MIDSAPLAGAKTVPIAAGIDQRNYPLCTLEPSIALRPDFSCCIPRNLCLFNCPLHLTATKRSQTSGTAVGTVSLKSEAASRSVRMLRTAMGPAITGWLEDPDIDAQIASAAKLIESDISLPELVRIMARTADLQINGGAA
jgi:hypothetical protein